MGEHAGASVAASVLCLQNCYFFLKHGNAGSQRRVHINHVLLQTGDGFFNLCGRLKEVLVKLDVTYTHTRTHTQSRDTRRQDSIIRESERAGPLGGNSTTRNA